MAKEKIKETVKNPEAQGSGTEKKKAEKNGFLFGLLVLLITLIVIVSVVGGVFFIVIKKQCKRAGGKIQKQPEKYSCFKNGFASSAGGLRPS